MLSILIVTFFSLPFRETDGANYMFEPPSPTPNSMFEPPSPTPNYYDQLNNKYITIKVLSSAANTRDMFMNQHSSNSTLANTLLIELQTVLHALKGVISCLFSS